MRYRSAPTTALKRPGSSYRQHVGIEAVDATAITRAAWTMGTPRAIEPDRARKYFDWVCNSGVALKPPKQAEDRA